LILICWTSIPASKAKKEGQPFIRYPRKSKEAYMPEYPITMDKEGEMKVTAETKSCVFSIALG
jgi:hypothetical protein